MGVRHLRLAGACHTRTSRRVRQVYRVLPERLVRPLVVVANIRAHSRPFRPQLYYVRLRLPCDGLIANPARLALEPGRHAEGLEGIHAGSR